MTKHTQSYSRRRGFSELSRHASDSLSFYGPVFTPHGIVDVRGGVDALGGQSWLILRMVVGGRQWSRQIDQAPRGERWAIRAAYAFAREVAQHHELKARAKR